MSAEIEKELAVTLNRFRDTHQITEETLRGLLAPHAAEGFTRAWFLKGGVVLGDGSYQSSYHGERNLVDLQPHRNRDRITEDVGPRSARVLVAVSKGHLLGSIPLSPDSPLTQIDFLLFEPDRIYHFKGERIGGEYYPRTP